MHVAGVVFAQVLEKNGGSLVAWGPAGRQVGRLAALAATSFGL